MQGKLSDPLADYEAQSMFWDKALQLHPDSFALQLKATEALMTWSVYVARTDQAKSMLIRKECYEGFIALLKANPGRGTLVASLFSAANNVVFAELTYEDGSLENARKVIKETELIASRFEPTYGDQARYRSNYSLFLKTAAIVDSEGGNASEALRKLNVARENLQAMLDENPRNNRIRHRVVDAMISQSRLLLSRDGEKGHEKAKEIALKAGLEVESLKGNFYAGLRYQVSELLAGLAGHYADGGDLKCFQMLHSRANEITGHRRTEFLQMQIDKLIEIDQLQMASEVVESFPTQVPAVLEFLKNQGEKLDNLLKSK